MTAGRVSA